MKIRIAAAQINTTVGDIEGNVKLIEKYIEKSLNYGVDIIAFPELSITGYPPEDLLHNEEFIAKNLNGMKYVSNLCKEIICFVGYVDKDFETNSIYNSVAALSEGKFNFSYYKNFLPNYGVFDEKRYFSPGNINDEVKLLDYKGIKIGANICEDLWENGPPDVFHSQASAGAELIININASPYEIGKSEQRIKLLSSKSKINKCFSLYVNQIGGQDELVFDGGSMLSGPDGQLLCSSKYFEENLMIVDIDIQEVRNLRKNNNIVKNNKTSPKLIISKVKNFNKTNEILIPEINIIKIDKIESIYKALVLGTHDYITKTGFTKSIIGLSGGIDSALVTVLTTDAIGNNNIIAVNMPSRYSSSSSKKDSKLLCEKIGVEFIELKIENIHQSFEKSLSKIFEGTAQNVAEENLQSRIRGTIVMALANKFNYLVMVTGNKSEMATGYATLYGDMAGAFAIIKDIPKSLVYELAIYRNKIGPGTPIPDNILNKPPSAELKPNQLDSDSLPPYDQLDRIIENYVERHMTIDNILEKENILQNGAKREVVEQIIKSINKNEYKRRQSPPGIKITSTSFGKDWRMPLASKWDEKS